MLSPCNILKYFTSAKGSIICYLLKNKAIDSKYNREVQNSILLTNIRRIIRCSYAHICQALIYSIDAPQHCYDSEASLRTIPLYPETIRAIKFSFSLGCDLQIVSDGNHFFIKTILQTHDLLQYFTEIKTNPAFVEESGRLRICPFHPFTEAPHGCNLCPPNMCKGAVIDEMRKSIEDGFNKRFIYLGDGAGDFCPTLKLTEGDDVMARKEYPLWKLIEKNPTMVKAQVHGWSNAKDVEDLLMKLLKP